MTQWLPKSMKDLVLDSEISWIYQLFGLLGTPKSTSYLDVSGMSTESMQTGESMNRAQFPKWEPSKLFQNVDINTYKYNPS